MLFEDGHPNTSLRDWEKFRSDYETLRNEDRPSLIEEIIDRSETDFPDWFIPLARGGAIASEALLRKAGHLPGWPPPSGWLHPEPDVYERVMGPNGILAPPGCPKNLVVRRCGDQQLWTVEQWGGWRKYEHSDEVLVFAFGSTPVLTRDHAAAIRVAERCCSESPLHGLRWINACPNNYTAAVHLAKLRSTNEAPAS